MVKRLLEHLYVKIYWRFKKRKFPLVEDLEEVIHLMAQSLLYADAESRLPDTLKNLITSRQLIKSNDTDEEEKSIEFIVNNAYIVYKLGIYSHSL